MLKCLSKAIDPVGRVGLPKWVKLLDNCDVTIVAAIGLITILQGWRHHLMGCNALPKQSWKKLLHLPIQQCMLWDTNTATFLNTGRTNDKLAEKNLKSNLYWKCGTGWTNWKCLSIYKDPVIYKMFLGVSSHSFYNPKNMYNQQTPFWP